MSGGQVLGERCRSLEQPRSSCVTFHFLARRTDLKLTRVHAVVALYEGVAEIVDAVL